MGKSLGRVYLIKAIDQNIYKIGKTRRVTKRMRYLRTNLPFKVEPVHVIETYDPAGLEKEFHQKFADKRVNGEWFKLAEADIELFKAYEPPKVTTPEEEPQAANKPAREAKSNKRQVFIEEYLKCWNASEAARKAGYKGKANVVGPRLLADVSINAAIQARLDELKMSADEVLLRLADQARGSIADFVHVDEAGQIKVSLANADKLHLVRKISLTAEGGLQIELYDAQDALKLIGQHHKLFTQKHELETPDLVPLLDVLKQQVNKFYGGGD